LERTCGLPGLRFVYPFQDGCPLRERAVPEEGFSRHIRAPATVAANRTVEHLRLVAVMRPAQEPDSIDSGPASHRPRIVVMELQEAPLAAPPPVRSHPGAAIAVASPHGALHVSGDVPGVYGLPPAPPRPLSGGEFLPVQLPNK